MFTEVANILCIKALKVDMDNNMRRLIIPMCPEKIHVKPVYIFFLVKWGRFVITIKKNFLT